MKSPQTLKHKLTLAYSVGILVSLVICFAAIYAVQRHILLKNIRQRLNFFANEFQYEYLTGNEYTLQHNLIESRKLPAACRQLIKQHHPGFEILSIVLNPSRRIEIIGQQGDEIVCLTFTHDGAVIETAVPISPTDRIAHMEREFNEEGYAEGPNQFFFLLLDPNGTLLARSPFLEDYVPKFLQHNFKAAQMTPRPAPTVRKRRPGLAETIVIRNHGTRMRVLRHTLYDGNILLLAANLSDYDKNLNRLLIIFLCSLVAMPIVSLSIGYFIASQVSNAINRVTTAAREIESGDYSKRVRRGGEGREIDLLVDAFNDMTGRTERLLNELKTISENIAHDLRTPLTRMRGKAELTLFSGGVAAASGPETELAGVVAEECGDMLEMINTMLDITQTENRLDFARVARIDLRHLVTRSLELFSTLAEDKQITLSSDLPVDPVMMNGHASKLQRMIANLLDNALKFTPRGGAVTVGLAHTEDAITLTVADTGCGIPPIDQPHVFDRFYRSSASRTLPGNGLGLSLVRAIVIAHGGAIEIQSVPKKGATFIVRFRAS